MRTERFARRLEVSCGFKAELVVSPQCVRSGCSIGFVVQNLSGLRNQTPGRFDQISCLKSKVLGVKLHLYGFQPNFVAVFLDVVHATHGVVLPP